MSVTRPVSRLTRGVTAFAAGLGLVLCGTVAAAAPAAAETPSYVSKKEFGKVTKGMRKQRVHEIFDVSGKQTYFASGTQWSPPEQWREYPTASDWGYVEVDYKKREGVWRVTAKYAFWG